MGFTGKTSFSLIKHRGLFEPDPVNKAPQKRVVFVQLHQFLNRPARQELEVSGIRRQVDIRYEIDRAVCLSGEPHFGGALPFSYGAGCVNHLRSQPPLFQEQGNHLRRIL